MTNSTLTNIRLETDLSKKITLMAIQLHRPKNDVTDDVINKALRHYLKVLEYEKSEDEKLVDSLIDSYDFGE